MSQYFAEINEDGTVLRVIVADSLFIQDLPGTWVETFMSEDNVFAGPGYTYDTVNAEFIPLIPIAEEPSDLTELPAYPIDGNHYQWDSLIQEWVPIS